MFSFTKLQEPTRYINLGGVDYELSPLTLKVEIDTYAFFKTEEESNGWAVFQKKVQDQDALALIQFAWILIKDKSAFNSMDDFVEKATSIPQKDAGKMIAPIYETLMYSAIEQEKILKKKTFPIFKTVILIGLLYTIYWLVGIKDIPLQNFAI